MDYRSEYNYLRSHDYAFSLASRLNGTEITEETIASIVNYVSNVSLAYAEQEVRNEFLMLAHSPRFNLQEENND